MVIGLVSEDGSMDKDDLSNYIVSNMQDPISRTAGVGDFQVFGAQYAMRIWLDPAKLNNFQLTPVDVKTRHSPQNVQVSSGQLGGLPALAGPAAERHDHRQDPSADRRAVRQHPAEGQPGWFASAPRATSLKSAWAARTTASAPQFNGKPASGLAVKLATGANALDTAKAIAPDD